MAAFVAVAAVALGLGAGDDHVASAGEQATPQHSHEALASAAIHTKAGHAFQDEMRKLWEDHVTWTRLAIVSFVDDLDDLDPTVARLIRNQSDIGNAIRPFYGKQAAARLTALLEGHINGAVELLTAAKAGDQAGVERESAEWYRNGNQIADFLSAANRDNWPRKTMRSMMKKHLDDTLLEATQRLQGDHVAEVRTYDHIHDHILKMADALSSGIIAQFPEKFE
ncbi:MAG TPA: hypothetical protein VFY99_04875 [Solirubrobacterales bacterium]